METPPSWFISKGLDTILYRRIPNLLNPEMETYHRLSAETPPK